MSAAHMPAGPMGIDKGLKDQSPPFIYLPNTIDVGRRAGGWGWGVNPEKIEWYDRISTLFLTTWLLELELSIM